MSEQIKKKKGTNYYLTLDIMPGASHNEILHAYNRAKNTYTNGSLAAYSLLEGDSHDSIMNEIETAFLILGNPPKRREYDMEMGYKTWTEEDSPRYPKVTSLASIRSVPRAPAASAESSATSATSATLATVAKMSTAATSASADSELNSSATPVDFEAMDREVEAEVVTAPKEASPASVVAMKARAQMIQDAPFGERITGVSFEPNPEFEERIAECTEVDGAFLKAVRIYRSFTVEGLAQRCKLSSSHIIAIENEEAGHLHQPVYLRGHIYLITHALELPGPDLLARRFVERVANEGKITRPTF